MKTRVINNRRGFLGLLAFGVMMTVFAGALFGGIKIATGIQKMNDKTMNALTSDSSALNPVTDQQLTNLQNGSFNQAQILSGSTSLGGAAVSIGGPSGAPSSLGAGAQAAGESFINFGMPKTIDTMTDPNSGWNSGNPPTEGTTPTGGVAPPAPSTPPAPSGATAGAIGDATGDAASGATAGAIGGATGDAISGAPSGGVSGGTGGAAAGATGGGAGIGTAVVIGGLVIGAAVAAGGAGGS